MFEPMFDYVEKVLTDGDGRKSRNKLQSFRDRFEHIKRVYRWVERLTPDFPDADINVAKTAAIFHDAGYAGEGYKKDHHIKSANLFMEYANDKNFDSDFISKVIFCITNHYQKENMYSSLSSPELKLLIEADLLDEEGAMGIAFDLMVTGATFPRNYEQGYEMILNHSAHIYDQNYMITPLAKKYWEQKRKLVRDFMESYLLDMEMAEYK